jgi:hypothetical protein
VCEEEEEGGEERGGGGEEVKEIGRMQIIPTPTHPHTYAASSVLHALLISLLLLPSFLVYRCVSSSNVFQNLTRRLPSSKTLLYKT